MGLHNPFPAFFLAMFLTIVPVLSAMAQEDAPVIVSAHDFMVDGFHEILDHFDNDPLKITADLGHGYYDRTVAELVILVKALRLGGLTNPIEFVGVCNARRAVEELIRGHWTVIAQQLDLSVLNQRQNRDDLYITDPISRTGEFHKLFYCLKGNTSLLAARTVEEINARGRGILGVDWDNDRTVLRDMGFTNLTKAATFDSMIKMILAGRADWIPMEASNTPDLSRIMEGQRFVPIPGIRFSLIEERSFLVSRAHPTGKATFDALQKGLKVLREQGFIRDALASTGFYRTDDDNWRTLNEDAVRKAFSLTKP